MTTTAFSAFSNPTRAVARRAALGAAVALAAVLAFAGMTPAAASTPIQALAAAPIQPVPANASDVNDFSFSSFSAVYELSRDSDGRSLLTVEETLVAEFPDFDQNRGIRRELVERFDGRPTDIDIVSVTDENGEPREFDTEGNDEFLEVTIAGDNFVRDTQVYVITYVQHNVTRYFDDTGVEEFYWDTNGTGWAQNFDVVSATIVLDPSLLSALTGDFAAYVGYAGSNTPGNIVATDTGFLASAANLTAYENLTVSIAFEPGTFEPRDSSFAGAPWPFLSLFGALGGIGAAIAAAFVRFTKLQDAPGRGTIIPEYVAPKGVSIPLSAVISHTTTKVTAAHIVGLAVAGNIRVVEAPDSGRKPQYILRFVTAEGAGADDVKFLHVLFGASLDPGEDHEITSNDTKTATKMSKFMQQITKDATTSGYRKPLPTGAIVLVILGAAAAAFISFIFGVIALDQSYGGAIPGITLGIGFLSLCAAIAFIAKLPLEAKGVELRDYLLGLKMYIKLAEADRLKYLQSPQGAERTPVATGDSMQMLKLNEKLLPYAVLFGLEKQWTDVLGKYYEQTDTQPTWYAGSTAFNAAVFASSMSSLSSSVSSSFSSSSGGSGGGGSSGGGGGGGGGGGV